ncbi:MAG: phosphoribulokinase [Pseudonocardiaceae bacterium]
MVERFVIQRAFAGADRPVMLAVAGDSATGKTTLTAGLAQALGPDRVTVLCADDYHRYDRVERVGLPFTPLHPDCNYIDIMEQHLQLLALGRPILKPVYDHCTGRLARPELVEPTEFVIVEGLLPLHSRRTRACFDVSVYLDPPEDVRRSWKLTRDCRDRGHTPAQVLDELQRREPESEAHVRPQRRHADIIVRFAPIAERGEDIDDPLSATLLLRPTIRHPGLHSIVESLATKAIHLKLVRDVDNRPVDALHIHAYAPREVAEQVERAIWAELVEPGPVPTALGALGDAERSEPLALTQLLLLYHLEGARTSRPTATV